MFENYFVKLSYLRCTHLINGTIFESWIDNPIAMQMCQEGWIRGFWFGIEIATSIGFIISGYYLWLSNKPKSTSNIKIEPYTKSMVGEIPIIYSVLKLQVSA